MLKDIELKIKSLKEEYSLENQRHEKEVNRIITAIKKAEKEKDIVLAGFNKDKIDIAQAIIYCKGIKTNYGKGDTIKTVKNCINDVLDGFKQLKKGYFGCKNYYDFICQGSNHPYGFGPSHGSIVFEIGLKQSFRMEPEKITDIQVDAILYHLNMISDKKYRDIVFQD